MQKLLRFLVFLFVLPSAAGCVINPDAFSDGERSAPEGWLQFRFADGTSTLLIETTGEIRFDPSGETIAPDSQDAVFRVEETIGDLLRKVELSLGESGEPIRNYWENAEPRNFGSKAQQWLADLLPRVLRETGLLADARTAHLLSKGGIDRVLEEIELTASTDSKRVYAQELLAQARLSAEQVNRLITDLRQIQSGSRLKDVLAAIAPELPEDGEISVALIDACAQIASSSSRRACLRGIADARPIDSTAAIALAGAAAGINSSSERAATLIGLIEESERTADVDLAIVEAISGIRSASERSRAVRALIDAEPDSSVLGPLAQQIGEISSSAERTSCLQRLARLLPNDDPELMASYLAVVRGLSSQAAKERVLLPLLRKETLAEPSRTLIRQFVESELPDGVLRRRLLSKLAVGAE